MKKSFSLTKKICYVTLCALLIFALSMTATGSWFTDSGSVRGDLTKPVIQPTLVYKSNSTYVDFGSNSFYWSSTSDNKEVYIKFDSTNTVKNQICRITISVAWGTLTNGTWTAKTHQPVDSLALTPTNFDTAKWQEGVNGNTDIDAWLTENGITDDVIAQLEGDMTRADIIASIKENLSGSGNQIAMRYYYNSVVNVDNTQYIKILDGFSFDTTNFNSSDFAGLTAKVSISVEADSVSDRVIGETGYWVYDAKTKTYCTDRPTDELIANWKNSI